MIHLTLKRIKNPSSAKDAGSFTVTTLQYMNNSYYDVDSLELDRSFVPVPAQIEPLGQIKISNPMNSARQVEYEFNFMVLSDTPSASYLQVNFPPEVRIDASTA